jgi:mRNA interferase RelE/StbE
VTYHISVSHEADKLLDRLDRPTERRLRARFVQLGDDPFDPRLSAPFTERPGVRKSRVGGWRILFTVNRGMMVVNVVTVNTRGRSTNTHDDLSSPTETRFQPDRVEGKPKLAPVASQPDLLNHLTDGFS